MNTQRISYDVDADDKFFFDNSNCKCFINSKMTLKIYIYLEDHLDSRWVKDKCTLGFVLL